MTETVFGLIGNPVGHSLSPPMHTAAFDELGMEARYHAFEVTDVGTAVEGAAALGFGGLNVTVPHKRAAMRSCDELSDVAETVGAVNTLEFRGDAVAGHNTDVAGVRLALEREIGDLDGRDCLVVGAGGAARAMVVALAEAGCGVTVLNRTVEKAEDLAVLAADLGADADGGGLSRLGEAGSYDVVLNATSVGMEADESVLNRKQLEGASFVFDAVYSPVETRLLREARAAGATPIDGVGMLVLQGAESFRIWTGREPPVDVMEREVRSRLS